MGKGNPYKKNKGGLFGTKEDHDYVLYEPNKDRDIEYYQKEGSERDREDAYLEDMLHDNIQDDYKPKVRHNTEIYPVSDKQVDSFNKRLDTLEDKPRLNTNSLRKLQDEVEALQRKTHSMKLDGILSRIKSLWSELR